MTWICRLIAFLLSIFKQPSPIPEPFNVPEIPVAEGLPANMPTIGVQQVLPPAEYFGSLSRAIEHFSAATLQPGDRGGLVSVATIRPDGSRVFNLAIVQKTGKKGEIVGWVGKTWGAPLANGWETGIAWRQRW